MREKVFKQVVGIDVAQKELVVCLGKMLENLSVTLYTHKSFTNDKKGFRSLLAWVNKFTEKSASIRYVMEATGVYHESLAYYLDENNKQLSIVLPNKICNYAKSLDIKTVTDKTASEAITRFGLERTLDNWVKPKPIYKTLRQLTRERGQIVDERTVLKNQIHAEKAEYEPNKSSLKRFNQRIKLLERQEQQVLIEVSQLIKSDEVIGEYMKILCSMIGVGTLTAATVLAETNGFEMIRNKKQITSYAGLDVREKQSGTSVKGKPRISKRGNKYLRAVLYMPSFSAIKHDDKYKDLYTRLMAKHGISKKAGVAVQRKMLEMMFTLFKNKRMYDKELYKNQLEQKNSGPS